PISGTGMTGFTRNHRNVQSRAKDFMAAKEDKRRILLVDDHPIVRQGLGELIDAERDLTVCGTADSMNAALEQMPALKPDLVVVDISLKGSNGIELLKNIKVRYSR